MPLSLSDGKKINGLEWRLRILLPLQLHAVNECGNDDPATGFLRELAFVQFGSFSRMRFLLDQGSQDCFEAELNRLPIVMAKFANGFGTREIIVAKRAKLAVPPQHLPNGGRTVDFTGIAIAQQGQNYPGLKPQPATRRSDWFESAFREGAGGFLDGMGQRR